MSAMCNSFSKMYINFGCVFQLLWLQFFLFRYQNIGLLHLSGRYLSVSSSKALYCIQIYFRSVYDKVENISRDEIPTLRLQRTKDYVYVDVIKYPPEGVEMLKF